MSLKRKQAVVINEPVKASKQSHDASTKAERHVNFGSDDEEAVEFEEEEDLDEDIEDDEDNLDFEDDMDGVEEYGDDYVDEDDEDGMDFDVDALSNQLDLLDQVEEVANVDVFKKAAATETESSEDKKGIHVNNQNKLYQTALVSRMKLQQPQTIMEQLPPPEVLPFFTHLTVKDGVATPIGTEADVVSNAVHKKLCIAGAITAQCLNDLIHLEREMATFAGSSNVSGCLDLDYTMPHLLTGLTAKSKAKYVDENGKNAVKNDLQTIERYLNASWEAGTTKRNKVLDKWYKRVQVANAGGKEGLSLSSLNQPLSQQIQQIVDVEMNRYVQRSRLRRVSQRSLGVKPMRIENTGAGDDGGDLELLLKKQNEARFHNEIYDDNDLYSILLKDLSNMKSLNQSNLHESIRVHEAVLKKHSKLAKNVDTKASKGRKLKFEVLPRVANFMVPIMTPEWIAAIGGAKHDLSSADAMLGVAAGQEMLIDELLQGLFGQNERLEQGTTKTVDDEENEEEKIEEEEDSMDEDGDFEEIDPNAEQEYNAGKDDDYNEMQDGGDFSWFK